MTKTSFLLNNGVQMPALAMIDTGQRGAINPADATPEVIDLSIDAA